MSDVDFITVQIDVLRKKIAVIIDIYLWKIFTA